MTGLRRMRAAFYVLAVLTMLAVPAVAAGGSGSGGGGGTTTAAGAPAVAFTPTSLTFGAQAIGTTSAAQSITVSNTAPRRCSSTAPRRAGRTRWTSPR